VERLGLSEWCDERLLGIRKYRVLVGNLTDQCFQVTFAREIPAYAGYVVLIHIDGEF
jgi:hypothetical protein